jgi:hypothetical protein
LSNVSSNIAFAILRVMDIGWMMVVGQGVGGAWKVMELIGRVEELAAIQ